MEQVIGFRTPLEVRLLPENKEGALWQLMSPLIYYSKVAGLIEVPIDFITNFVSFSLLKGIGHRPSVVHDYLYSLPDFPRKIADKVFLEALLITEENPKLAKEMYKAVRVFGGFYKKGA